MEALHIALSQYGIKEIPGTGAHNPQVVKYFQESGFTAIKDDETSWCSALMNWCQIKAGRKGTGSLAARSWLNWGVPVKEPQLGDVAIFWRRDPKGWEGHVGFYINHNGTHVWLLGGNQSNMINIAAYPGTELLGYRRWDGGEK